MTTPIATAYVDILPTSANFAPALRRQIDEALSGVKAKAKSTGDAIATGVGGGAGRAGRDMTHMGEAGSQALSKIKEAVGALVALEGLRKLGEAFLGAGEAMEHLSDRILVGTGKSGASLDKLVGTAKAIALEVPNSFADIGAAVTQVNQRLDLTGAPLKEMAKRFLDISRITGEQLSIPETTKALTAFGVAGKDQGDVLEQLFAASQRTGVTMGSLVSALDSGAPTLKRFGFDAARSADLLANLDKAGVSSDKTVAGLRLAFSKFSKAGEDPRKALIGVVAQMHEFIKAGDSPKAGALAGKFFGTRGAAAFTSAVASGALSVKTLTADAAKVSAPIEKAADKTLHFGEQMKILKHQITEAVGPTAQRVLEFLGSKVEELRAKFASPEFSAFAGRIGAVLGPLAGAVGGTLEQVGRLGAALGDIAGPAIDGLSQLAAAITPGVTDAIAALIDAIGQVAGFLTQHKDLLASIAIAMTLVIAPAIYAVAAAWAAEAAAAVAAAALTALAWVVAAAPVALLVAAIALVVLGLIEAWKHSETFRKIVVGAFNFVKDAIVTAVSIAFRVMTLFFRGILEGVKGIAHLWSKLPKILGGGVASHVEAAANEVLHALSEVQRGIDSLKDKDIHLNVIVKTIADATPFRAKGATSGANARAAEIAAGQGASIPLTAAQIAARAAEETARDAANAVSNATKRHKNPGDNGAADTSAADAAKAAKAAAKAAAAALKAAGRQIDGRGFVDAVTGGPEKIKAAFDKLIANLKAGNRAALASYAAGIEKTLLSDSRRRDVLSTAIDAATTKLKDLRKTAKDFAATVRDAIIAPGSVAEGTQGIGTTFTGIRNNLRAAIASATAFATAIGKLQALKLNNASLRQLIEAGPEAGLAAAQAIAGQGAAGVGQINTLQADLTKRGKDLGTSVAGTFFTAGIKAAEGILAGLKSKEAALDAAMDRLADRMVAHLKRALGIHSPSAVFFAAGAQIPAGLAGGVRAGTPAAAAAATSMANSIVFASGAVQVHGVADPDRARLVGSVVGHGVADVLARNRSLASLAGA